MRAMILALVWCATAAAEPAGYDAAAWREDLGALVGELASHYANLGWAVSERKMDLPGLLARTDALLRDAKSRGEATHAIESFLDAFGDGHLFVEWSEPAPKAAASGGLCARLGYGRQAKPGIDFSQTGAYSELADDDARDFPGGVLRLPNGASVGVLRIGLFMGETHPAMCEAARRQLGLADDAKCDEACADKLAIEVMDRMTAALERRAKALAAAHVAALAIDLTRNGGGSDWVEPAARVLTPVPLKTPRMGFVRHEHWAKQFREKLALVRADRAKHDDPQLAAAEATLRAALDEATAPCDVSAWFRAGAPPPACTQLVTNRIFTSGLFAYARPGAFAGWSSAETLWTTGMFRYHEGVVRLPLVVLVDGGTASASEEFASMLADNHAAIIVGSVTTGSGCGFTNGGIPTTLPRSRGRVHMPDCARLRADGRNEVSGVVPDVLLPLASHDSPFQRAAKFVAGIAAASKRR
jgi:hypothetical protein